MKKQFELGPLMEHFPVDVRDSVFRQAKDEGQDVDTLMLQRRGWAEKAKTNQLDEGSRAAVKYVSTRTMDRDKEIVVPKGINTKEYMKYAHVLWGHNYNLPPLGSDEWIKPDEFGLLAKTVYADTGEGTMANVLWHLVQQGHQRASSIGFVPLTYTEPGHNDWDKVVSKLEGAWPELTKEKDNLRRIITKCILLEHSDVSLPINVDSEVVSVAKGYGADDDILHMLGLEEVKAVPEGFADWDAFMGETEEFDSLKPYPNEHSARLVEPGKYVRFRRQNDKFGEGIDAIFGITEDGKVELQAIRFDKTKFTVAEAKAWLKEKEYKVILFEAASEGRGLEIETGEDGEGDNADEKAVIPYLETPKAPEATPWEGAREVVEADVKDLKVMCTWYDKENPDMKGSYKLAHHKAGGKYVVVWRGVAAAIGALLGARGGVKIPAADRAGVHSHLAKHYAQFDKKPPELREYVQGELKAMFPELYDGGEGDAAPAGQSVRVVKRSVRVVEAAVPAPTIGDMAAQEVSEAFDRLRGRV